MLCCLPPYRATPKVGSEVGASRPRGAGRKAHGGNKLSRLSLGSNRRHADRRCASSQAQKERRGLESEPRRLVLGEDAFEAFLPVTLLLPVDFHHPHKARDDVQAGLQPLNSDMSGVSALPFVSVEAIDKRGTQRHSHHGFFDTRRSFHPSRTW